MLATLWLPALIKALATALVVVFASAIAEAFGPFWGALIASLPVSAGPVYVFLAMQHGADFVAASALSSCAANAATGLFLIVYAGLTQRLSPWRCLAVAVSAWLVGSLATQQIDWTPATALVLNLVVYGCGFIVPSPARVAGVAPVVRVRRRWFDLPVRAVAVAGFVSLVVAVSSLLGPRATGIAAVFPVSLISLIVIVRPRIGGAAASLLAANALRSMLGFGVMLLALHLAIRPWGIAVAFGIALLASALWSGGLLALRSQWMMGWPGSRPEPVLGRPLGRPVGRDDGRPGNGGDAVMRRLCVFCGSSPGYDPRFLAAAREFGRVLASRGIGLVFGGASIGLMGALANTVLEHGGEVIGVIPDALVQKEVAHRGLADLRIVQSMHERKAVMAALSDGFVALPGGIGTLEELFEVWTWAQLGDHAKPCAIYNVARFYDGLTAFLDQVVTCGFLRPAHREMLIVESTASGLLDRLRSYRPPDATKWIDPGER